MSKAEELAEIKYPIHSVRIVPARGGGYYADKHLREGFIAGYHQAEKDLELTWRNMEEIVEIANLLETEWLNSTPWDGIRDCGFYKEVLKRFRERKRNENGNHNM